MIFAIQDGYAPLHLAVRRESEEEIEKIIDVLVISGCDLNQITFPKGNTTLHLVVENATNEAVAVNIVSKLMIYKADQTLRNRVSVINLNAPRQRAKHLGS